MQHPCTMLTTAIRQRRMTDAQKESLETLYGIYARKLVPNQLITPLSLFQTEYQAYVLEIGFGMGHSLIEMALNYPKTAYLGIEVHKPGLARVLSEIERLSLQNIQLIEGNALEALLHHFPESIFDTLQIFFPDPWPKRKHLKRRLIQPETIIPMAKILKIGGILHLATDWEPYALHMMKTLSAAEFLENIHSHSSFSPRLEHRPVTKFEKRGLRLGHAIWDLEFRRIL